MAEPNVTDMESLKVYGGKKFIDVAALVTALAMAGVIGLALVIKFFGANLMTFFSTIFAAI